MSVRHQQIIDAIKARLATILKTNGYFTDAGNFVGEWHQMPLPQLTTSIYHLDVKDGPEIIDSLGVDGPLGCWNRTLNVRIEHTCASDGTDSAIEVLGKMVADTVKAVGVDPYWGGLVISTDIDKGKPEAIQDENKFASQTAILTIKWRTASGSPDDTPIVQNRQTLAPPTSDITTAIMAQFETQIAAGFIPGPSWLWRSISFAKTDLPAVDVKTDGVTDDTEAVNGANNLDTRTLPVRTTIMYTEKVNLSDLRAEKEAVLTAIETDPTLGGYVKDCIPKSTEWSFNQEETAIIGITVIHDVLFQISKWEN